MFLLVLNDGDLSVKKEPTSPDLTWAMGKPVYDQTPVSEVRPINVAEEEEKEEDEHDEQDSRPLSWCVKKPVVPSIPTPTKDQVKIDKSKEKVS